MDFVIVPADSEYRSFYLDRLQSRGMHARANAAMALGRYAGSATVDALRAALKDSGRDSLETGGAQRMLVFYPVRQAAYFSLRRLGADVPKPEGYVEGSEAWFVEDRIKSYLGDD